MEMHSASAVLLVRPAAFGFNAEAAASNVFAHASADPDLQRAADAEFDGLAKALANAGVEVLIFEDSPDPMKPDAVFPNNWLSFHADGTMVVYPMATAPRRLERRANDVKTLVERHGYAVRRHVDLSAAEADGRYLEGTGSLILDRKRKQAFANRSDRTDGSVVAEFDRQLGYRTHLFDAFDPGGRPIYHTNVMMSLGTHFAVLCREAVADVDREPLESAIEDSGRTIIDVTFEQLRHFGCNLIELAGRGGDPIIAMSGTAMTNLPPDQRRALEAFGTLVAADVPTIEEVGGGSVRCMIAEMHLPRVN